MSIDEHFMRRCIQLARNGFQHARPNPMVGAVVVCGDRIIGEGYHVRCGEGHAEVNALASVRPEDEHLLPESTIYVSLEPCAHYGKTPPCALLIVEKGLRRCVVGCIDPFSKVQGRGIAILRDAGIEVTVGVLEEECRDLNKRFITFHSLHRPFITLKWAQTSDGFIGYKDHGPDHVLKISNAETQMLSHRRRSEHEAILVGRRTVECDNPSLTVRHWNGPDPLPVVLGRRELLEASGVGYHLLRNPRTLFFSSVDEAVSGLYEHGVQSLLVEGGADVLQSFIDLGLWDEAYVETGVCKAGEGVAAPRLSDEWLTCETLVGGHVVRSFRRG
ncbi:MAG: bifunctional diaminohydroxyphosphoribosylaminopyrimidine deaminase/5-amino-6-(5-phosphoribosylamino)uracil reductase RibD [Bacteroidaceae bacterium]|nr:bifunctional diaminohydroxyphosphoribosylaminopyrimidine deaminase/5-amino-6-(5-phosphoribosylamino)uracil reductase RibD [Bacteroidaceae bacterium]